VSRVPYVPRARVDTLLIPFLFLPVRLYCYKMLSTTIQQAMNRPLVWLVQLSTVLRASHYSLLFYPKAKPITATTHELRDNIQLRSRNLLLTNRILHIIYGMKQKELVNAQIIVQTPPPLKVLWFPYMYAHCNTTMSFQSCRPIPYSAYQSAQVDAKNVPK